jgi:hypothetical protein
LLACGFNDWTDERVDVGVVVSVTETPTSWNDSHRSRIETTGGVYFVRGIVSASKGEGAYLRKKERGGTYICLSEHTQCRLLIGYQ